MMSTTTITDEELVEFQQQWEGTNVDLQRLAMFIDASQLVLKKAFKEPPTTDQVIAFARVVATTC